MPIIDSYKDNVRDISPIYADDVLNQLLPKTYTANISNGNSLITPTPPNFTHGFILNDLEKMHNSISNSKLYTDNHLYSIPDLVYQFDSSRQEINYTVLIPIMICSMKAMKKKLDDCCLEEEDVIVILIKKCTSSSQYVTVKTKQGIIDTLVTYISSLNLYKLNNNNEVYLLLNNILANNSNRGIYTKIINTIYNRNMNIQQVRITNARKNNILKTILTQVVQQNLTLPINNTAKIMVDLQLLPACPSTLVLIRDYPQSPCTPHLVRLISAYASMPAILTRTYIITKENNDCIIGMDVDDFIQIQYEYTDTTTRSQVVKNLLYIKKTDNYSYEIKELDNPQIITNKEEIVTNKVTITYLNNERFTFYYVLGSFAGYGSIERNICTFHKPNGCQHHDDGSESDSCSDHDDSSDSDSCSDIDICSYPYEMPVPDSCSDHDDTSDSDSCSDIDICSYPYEMPVPDSCSDHDDRSSSDSCSDYDDTSESDTCTDHDDRSESDSCSDNDICSYPCNIPETDGCADIDICSYPCDIHETDCCADIDICSYPCDIHETDC